MGKDGKRHRSKSRERDDHSESKRKRRDKEGKEKKHKSKRHKSGKDDSDLHGYNIVDDNANDDEYWVEKKVDNNPSDTVRMPTTDSSVSQWSEQIPIAESLKLTSHASESVQDASTPPARASESKLKRDDWMIEPNNATSSFPYTSTTTATRVDLPSGVESFTEDYGDAGENRRDMSGNIDFFSSMGTERKRRGAPEILKVGFQSRLDRFNDAGD